MPRIRRLLLQLSAVTAMGMAFHLTAPDMAAAATPGCGTPWCDSECFGEGPETCEWIGCYGFQFYCIENESCGMIGARVLKFCGYPS